MSDTHLAFSIPVRDLHRRILIPKYYDPDLAESVALASHKYDLPELREVLLPGESGSRLGDWIRRGLYGTGAIPYVRTSDLAHWRIRPDYKKGVAEEVYESLRERQDVQAGDILMVAHGTYLVGTVAIVTEGEERLVLQDHMLRLRARPDAGVSSLYLLAALSTAFVRRQVRARQFSADIIDKIGDRHLELRVPIPRESALVGQVDSQVAALLQDQDMTRRQMRAVTSSDLRMSRERAAARYQFAVRRSSLRRSILIPKYYDPVLEADLAAAERADSERWVALGELAHKGILHIGAGVEVGKLAYGSGDVPFVRTSDIVDWEIKHEVRQGVSEALYTEHAEKAGLKRGDVLVVRDGTYLVGSSALVTDSDLPSLTCGGIFRLRIETGDALDSYKLLGALNLPVVRRQMRARQFTRDVIDTLGNRILEVRIPPLDSPKMREMAEEIQRIMVVKENAKNQIGTAVSSVEPPALPIIAGRPGWSMR